MIYNFNFLKMTRLKPYLLFLFIFIAASCSKDDDAVETVEQVDKSANQQTLGTSARDFLTDEEFTSINLEIGYVEGFEPTQSSVDGLVEFLLEHCHKPANINVTKTLVPATADDSSLDIDEVVAIESENRTVYNTGDELGVWVFFADNISDKDEGNSVILGTAYRNTSCVIYEKTLVNLIVGGSLYNLESTTLHHEFGHLFGLVDLGTPMVTDHQDSSADDDGTLAPNHHCDVPGCLMYYQTVTDVFSTAMGNDIAEFDELCLADLQANGGK